MSAPNPATHLNVFTVEEYEAPTGKSGTSWTKIGVAFPNKDGSWNLRFDYLPARLADTTIQLRDIEPKDAAPTE